MACQFVEKSEAFDLKGFSCDENDEKGSKGGEKNLEMS